MARRLIRQTSKHDEAANEGGQKQTPGRRGATGGHSRGRELEKCQRCVRSMPLAANSFQGHPQTSRIVWTMAKHGTATCALTMTINGPERGRITKKSKGTTSVPKATGWGARNDEAANEGGLNNLKQVDGATQSRLASAAASSQAVRRTLEGGTGRHLNSIETGLTGS